MILVQTLLYTSELTSVDFISKNCHYILNDDIIPHKM